MPRGARPGAGLSYAQRAQLFRLRILVLALPLALCIAYQRWIAPRLGRAHAQRSRDALPRALSRVFLRMNGIRPKLSGVEHLAATAGRPRVLMVNHNSRFDGYILIAALDIRFKSFWSNTAHITTEGFSLIHQLGLAFDMFFVHDKSDKRRTLQEFRRAEAFLAEGETLSVFPEGTFSSDGEIRGFGSSCVSLAMRAGADILPVVMAGTEATFERQTARRGVKTVRIQVLPPISTAGLDRQDVARVTGELEALMNTQLRDLRAEGTE